MTLHWFSMPFNSAKILVQKLMPVQLPTEKDTFRWNLNTNGVFTVKSMYAEYMNGHTPFLRKYLWKMKVPLKIKIFMWFVNRKVILTRDNLIKRNWNGDKKCVFCHHDETVEHLFIECLFAHKIWRLLQFTFNIPPPTSLSNMFGSWFGGIDKKTKNGLRIGVCAFIWAIWNCRNDIVFNKFENVHFFQVVHRATYWITMWSYLLPQDQRSLMDAGCIRLMAVVRAILNRGGWQHDRRICAT